MVRKSIAFVLSITLALSLTACGGIWSDSTSETRVSHANHFNQISDNT